MSAAATSSPTQKRVTRRVFPWGVIALVTVFVAFAAGLIHLFALRFDIGDVYPPYSTLRSDPLGAKALFDSLGELPGIHVERNLRRLQALGTQPLRAADADYGERDFTVFLLGLDVREWPYGFEPEAIDRIEKIMQRGGRVVLTFQPTHAMPTLENLSRLRTLHAHDSHAGLHDGSAAQQKAKQAREPDLITRWGVDFRRRASSENPNASDSRVQPSSAARQAAQTPGKDNAEFALPYPRLDDTGDAAFAVDKEAVSWHSEPVFALGTWRAVFARWRGLYERRGQSVIVTRPFGAAGGELILVGDSYFLSNEGLRDHPSPALLAALAGSRKHVFFDESHLGLQENPGLATLARRYRLQGAVAAIALLVALFVWRNVVSLVPARAVDEAYRPAHDADTILGQSASGGYLNLLRRGVHPRELAGVCAAQWASSSAGTRSTAAALERVRALVKKEEELPLRRRLTPAAAYRAMCAAVTRK